MKSIKTERVLIRKLKKSDLPFYLQLETDSEVMKYITGGVPLSKVAIEEKLHKRVINSHKHQPLGFMIGEDRKSGKPMGAFMLLTERHEDPELGYILAKPFWGKGYGEEVCRALVGVAFQNLGVDRVVATTDPENTASIRVLEKLGFCFEKKHFFFSSFLQRELESNYYSLLKENF